MSSEKDLENRYMKMHRSSKKKKNMLNNSKQFP